MSKKEQSQEAELKKPVQHFNRFTCGFLLEIGEASHSYRVCSEKAKKMKDIKLVTEPNNYCTVTNARMLFVNLLTEKFHYREEC